MTEPPVVNRPQGVAPTCRTAPTPQFPADIVGRIHLDIVAAISTRVADADETRRQEIANRFWRNLPQLLGPSRSFLENRHQPEQPGGVARPGSRATGSSSTWTAACAPIVPGDPGHHPSADPAPPTSQPSRTWGASKGPRRAPHALGAARETRAAPRFRARCWASKGPPKPRLLISCSGARLHGGHLWQPRIPKTSWT